MASPLKLSGDDSCISLRDGPPDELEIILRAVSCHPLAGIQLMVDNPLLAEPLQELCQHWAGLPNGPGRLAPLTGRLSIVTSCRNAYFHHCLRDWPRMWWAEEHLDLIEVAAELQRLHCRQVLLDSGQLDEAGLHQLRQAGIGCWLWQATNAASEHAQGVIVSSESENLAHCA